MEQAGYYVEANAAYPDPRTGISREYDISGTNAIPVSLRREEFIFPIIICECENNSQPVVFFESESVVSFLFAEQARCSGMPVKFWTGKQYESIQVQSLFNFEKFHHYSKGSIATQYCTFSKKSQHAPWVAFHADDQHQTFSGIIDALEASIDDHYTGWKPPRPGESAGVNIQAYYPLLVLQGDIYLTHETRRGLSLKKVSHVQYRRQIWTAKQRAEYQIDVVNERFLPNYLKLIERETKAIVNRLRRRRKVVQAAITRLGREMRKRRKGVTVREALEP